MILSLNIENLISLYEIYKIYYGDKMKQKSVVTIQDISCYGKCSLTVALPVISAMGISCSVIPTATLSAHTAFDGFTFHSLTDDIPKISEHWKKEGLEFDGISSGYLGSIEQIEIISDFIDSFKNKSGGRRALVYVDPAMADRGRLYSGFDMEFVKSMKNLCRKADVIAPNITEAALLTGREYLEGGYDEEYISTMLKALTDIGSETAVITGVSYDKKTQGAVSYNRKSGEFTSYFSENMPVQCHGTGDVFSSVFFGAMVLGYDMKESLKIAVDFTVDCIKATIDDKEHWFGVKFELCIPELIRSLKK